MSGNPYEAPQARSPNAEETGTRDRRVGWAVVLTVFGAMWIVYMAAVFFTPGIDVHPPPRPIPMVIVVCAFVVANSPALVLFRLAWRAMR